MTEGGGSRFVVERVDTLPSRPWIFLSGRLDGEPIHVGSSVQVHYSTRPPVTAVVRAVELHTRPQMTTFAIDREFQDAVGPGALVIARR